VVSTWQVDAGRGRTSFLPSSIDSPEAINNGRSVCCILQLVHVERRIRQRGRGCADGCSRSAAWQRHSIFITLSSSGIEPDDGQNSGYGKGRSLSWDDSGNPIPRINRPLASRERYKKCSHFFEHFLDRLKKAKGIDNSRLFGNWIVSYGTNLRYGHELKDLPAIPSGGAAKDIRHGRHIVLSKKDTPLANYWLTLMQQANLPIDRFSHSTGIIPELLG
jgi:hypothetical protein